MRGMNVTGSYVKKIPSSKNEICLYRKRLASEEFLSAKASFRSQKCQSLFFYIFYSLALNARFFFSNTAFLTDKKKLKLSKFISDLYSPINTNKSQYNIDIFTIFFNEVLSTSSSYALNGIINVANNFYTWV